MRKWANSPRYLRAMQKINVMRPEHRAILSTVTADPAFAEDSIRKEIAAMITKTGRDTRERNFKLTKEIAASRNAMRDRDRSYNKGQNKKAVGLGIGNLALSAAGGVAERKRTKELMAMLEERMKYYKTANQGQMNENYQEDFMGINAELS